MIHITGVQDNMIANNLMPFIPTHPGEIIKDEIECRGISQRQLSDATGIAYSVINEVLNYVNANNLMSVYDSSVTTQKQVEFIEIVNLTNKMISLKGLKIVAERQDKDDPKTFTLSGCAPANQAVVVSGSSIAGLPIGVVNIIPPDMAATNALVNTQPFKYSLVNSSDTVLHSVLESVKPNSQKSRTLSDLAYATGVAALVDHDSINADLKHSPGYCTNGKLFIDGCR